MLDSSRLIVAVTGEDRPWESVIGRARALAAETGATVILYDIDAAGIFASPVPTAWSGEGQEELVDEEASGQRLDPDALEAAGRAATADQVRGLRAAGIDAWGWLPTSKDVADLGAYAERQGAAVVLVPPDLPSPGPIERVLGDHDPDEAVAETPVRFEVVEP